MITGMMTANETGFSLNISTMLFDISGLRVAENPHKNADNHPDHLIEVRTPRGSWMRVGSMWTAISEKTQRTYYSLRIKDRTGNQWRMNAVRNDETPEGQWDIVPLAGGETLPIALHGGLEILDDGNMVGSIDSYDFAMNILFLAVEDKADENHPDFRIETKSPAGTPIRMGSAWKATSQNGNDYFSIVFSSPTGNQHRANAVRQKGSPKHKFEIIELTERGPELVVA